MNFLFGFLIGSWLISFCTFVYYIYKCIKVDHSRYALGMWISVALINIIPAIMRILLTVE